MTQKKKSKLWLWIVAAFAIQIIAWSAWFIIASNHKVEEVPVLTRPSSN